MLDGPSCPPKSGDPAKQLVVLLHGIGADGNDLIALAPFYQGVLPDALFIAPNAPFPCDMAPFGYQWFSIQNLQPDTRLSGRAAGRADRRRLHRRATGRARAYGGETR